MILLTQNIGKTTVYAIDRVRIIKQKLEEDGQAQVQALSSLLGVSEVTVRRDLERLEAEGWLTRTHGGAVINRSEEQSSLSSVFHLNGDTEAFDEIASVALRMVSDGDVIMLTNGEVNGRIASRLGEKAGLTVLTNDIACAAYISQQDANRVVLLGGNVSKTDLALFGSMTISNLGKFYVNRLFVEVDGVSRDLQFTVDSQEKADLILEAKKSAQETIVLCPAERFSRNAFYRLGDLHFAQRIISNTELNEAYKSQIFTSDIPLYTSVAAFEGSE